MGSDYISPNRKAKEASTSRYIQQKVNDGSGALTKVVSLVSNTPDQSIINRLIVATQSVWTLAKNTLISGTTSLVKTLVPETITEIPPTAQNAEYGKIHVHETQGGHVIIIDDTPGNKRLETKHDNGSYTSMVENGDFTRKTMKDRYDFTLGDWKIRVEGDRVEIIQGDHKLEIRSSRITQIANDDIKNVDGNEETHIGADRFTQVDGAQSEYVIGSISNTCDADKSETIAGQWDVVVEGNINITSSAIVNVTAATINLN